MSSERIEELLAEALGWRHEDPDPVTRTQVDAMVQRRDRDELEEHFGRRLGFGTAGIRGALGPGPNRMNRLVARRVARGVAVQLATTIPDAGERGVVVGRDARHGSEEMAAELVETLAGSGFSVHRFDEPVPTPLAVFAVTHLGAAAGMVVTASHNPPSDNGIKVVWHDGAQIVAPIDAAISEAMERPAPDPRPIAPGRVHHLGGPTGDHEVVRAYLARARSLGAPPKWKLRVATTALHGVGATLLDRVLRDAGHTDLQPVRSQERPDPDFPTVAMPNPEEPGALDELLVRAGEVGAAVALAVDPDADRLAVAVPRRPAAAAEPAGWQVLTGDETGALLLWHLLARTEERPDRFAASTIVSSRLARRMCEAAGVRHVETLTGFKWLCRPGLEHPGWHQVLLYEEALGYAVGHDARDKDGITAARVLLDLAAGLAASGRSVLDVLDDLALVHGLHVSLNGSVRTASTSERAGGAVQRLVASPPQEVAGRRVRSWDRPAPDVARFVLEDDTRIVVRPSGTEPKVKHYLEAVVPVAERDALAAARAGAMSGLVEVRDALRGLLAL